MTALEFPSPPRRILLIKPSAIGDVVHALPVLNLLRKRWPDGAHRLAADAGVRGPARRASAADEVILFERRRFGRGWREPAAAKGLLAFMKRLRRGEFDLVDRPPGAVPQRLDGVADARAGAHRLRQRARVRAALLHPPRRRRHDRAARDRPISEGGGRAGLRRFAGRVSVSRDRRRPPARRRRSCRRISLTPCSCRARTGRRSAGRSSGSRRW